MNTTIGIDRDALHAAAKAAAARTTDLLDSLSEVEGARTVPGMDWTAAEVGAHLVTLYGRALGDMRRSTTPEETATLNETCLDELDERDPHRLAERLRDETPVVFDQVLASLPDDLEFPFHAGTTTTVGPVLGVLLLEFLVHGDDIANATGRRFDIPERDAALALQAASPLLDGWLLPAARMRSDRFAFALRELDATLVYELDDRALAFHCEAFDTGATAIRPSALLTRLLGRGTTGDTEVDRFAAMFAPF